MDFNDPKNPTEVEIAHELLGKFTRRSHGAVDEKLALDSLCYGLVRAGLTYQLLKDMQMVIRIKDMHVVVDWPAIEESMNRAAQIQKMIKYLIVEDEDGRLSLSDAGEETLRILAQGK